MITFTDRAAATVRRLRDDAGSDAAGHGLRVGVASGGCAGLEYTLAFEPEPTADDTVLAADGFSVFVDPASAPVLAGLRVDYADGLLGGGFTFENPNARTGCGCGSSFSVCESPADSERAPADPELVAEVEAALDGIRPVLQRDGGDVVLVDVHHHTAWVRLAGACSGCPSARDTLTAVVERRVREAVPAIARVVAVP